MRIGVFLFLRFGALSGYASWHNSYTSNLQGSRKQNSP